MEEEQEEVKLLGFWASPYSYRVIWSLKLKGVEYDYVEEDLVLNKSQWLLECNPVYKKIPVLFHGGKPIADSLVILEYIEETWPHTHPLLPKDPHQRAFARFWLSFAAEKDRTLNSILRSSTGGSEREKAAKEVEEVLKVLEDKGLGNNNFFGGDTINMVDIAYGWLAFWFECIEDVVGLKLLKPTTLPRLYAWAQNFKQVPIIKENLPDRKSLVDFLKYKREMSISRKANNKQK